MQNAPVNRKYQPVALVENDPQAKAMIATPYRTYQLEKLYRLAQSTRAKAIELLTKGDEVSEEKAIRLIGVARAQKERLHKIVSFYAQAARLQ